jgi:hypothetical protein
MKRSRKTGPLGSSGFTGQLNVPHLEMFIAVSSPSAGFPTCEPVLPFCASVPGCLVRVAGGGFVQVSGKCAFLRRLFAKQVPNPVSEYVEHQMASVRIATRARAAGGPGALRTAAGKRQRQTGRLPHGVNAGLRRDARGSHRCRGGVVHGRRRRGRADADE